MRLGAYPCVLEKDSLAQRIYQETEISERHRHRYEFNREYEEILTSYGLQFSGNSPDKNFAEIVEISDHPWFLACQFHPEFKSKPLKPHPLFVSFIQAASEHRARRIGQEGTSALQESPVSESN
jgi:CTP synthase